MINLIANEQFKKLGSKWNGVKWEAPKLAESEHNEIIKKFYENLIIIEVSVCKNERLKGKDWGYSHVRMIGGYIVASAKGRDSGAKLSEGVAVISGKFTSAGSVKNYICDHDYVILRLEVSRNSLELLNAEVEENRYTYTILSEPEPINELEKFSMTELLAEIEKRNKLN